MMLGPVSRSLLGSRMASRARVPRALVPPLCRRNISQLPPDAMAVYTAFPATLHYYSPHRVSSLYDCREKESRPYSLVQQAVYLADNGLVYPRVRRAVPHDPLLVCEPTARPSPPIPPLL